MARRGRLHQQQPAKTSSVASAVSIQPKIFISPSQSNEGDKRRSSSRRHGQRKRIGVAVGSLVLLALMSCVVQTNASLNLTIGYLPTLSGDLEKTGIAISGAVTYALDRIKQMDLLPGINLVLQVSDTKSDQLHSTKRVAEMMCSDVVAVFGLMDTCNVEATITSAFNRMMISHECTDNTVSNKKKFPTFMRTYPPDTQVTKSIIALLRFHNWNKFTVVAHNSPRWQMVADSLETLAKNNSMNINHRLNFVDRTQCCSMGEPCCSMSVMYDIIEKTRKTTRIYVFLGEPMAINEFMNTMGQMRLFNKGEYMVISVDRETYSPERARDYLWKNVHYTLNHCSALESPSQQAAQSLLIIITKPDDTYTNFQEQVRLYNQKPPFNFAKPDIFNYFTPHVPIYAAHLYDAVMLFANALSQLIKSANLTDPFDILETAKNGRSLFQKIIEQRQYTSVTGASILMDENGDSEGNYTVLGSVFTNVSMPLFVSSKNKFYCHYQMKPIGGFLSETTRTIFSQTTPIAWVGKRAPLDEPPCGYNYEKCRESDNRIRNSQIAAGVLGTIFIAFVIVILLVYRKWKVEQEIAGLVWKIDPKDVVVYPADGFQDKSTSKLSLASVAADQVFTKVSRYRGTIVRIKDLNFSKRREISRKTMKEMRLMREFRHDNINMFIGAAVEPNRIRVVTEYCHKGSLPDILENDDIKLEKIFIASLVNDLLKGMIYLHKTDMHCHGNLKSSNCVVTSRWVLQITDYGLHELRTSTENNCTEDHAHYRNLLWKAPELLRDPDAPICGTQKGDVYAFAVILFEILTRQGPFGDYKEHGLEPEVIVERIKAGPQPGAAPFRPDIQLLTDTEVGHSDYIRSCLNDCWAETPEQRPDFLTIRDRLRKMREGMKPFIMDQMMDMMVIHANNLEMLVNERTHLLYEEKQKTEDLLHRMLPKPVAQRLTKGFGVEPESYESVTIYFSDIVGFTKMSAESTPFQVVNFLNDLYTLFDSIIQGYDVYKVETIGDAYMVVSGLPLPNENHAGEIASMALEMLAEVKNREVSHRPTEKVLLRIGIHTGPVVSGVVGLSMPRYCLFGDSVNTASRMESNGESLRIHISNEYREALEKIGGYLTEERGLVSMKGKGEVLTHWLVGTTCGAIKRRSTVATQAPLFCRPSVNPGLVTNYAGNDTSISGTSNMSDLRRRSPRVLPRVEGSVMTRRVSTDSRQFRSSAAGGRMTSSLVQQAGKPHHHSMCYYDRKAGHFLDEGSISSSNRSSCSTIASQSCELNGLMAHTSRSVVSLRSNRTSLHRSCLLNNSTKAVNASAKVLIITDGDSNNADHCSCNSLPLVQRRCQSLCKFSTGDEMEHSSVRNRQFLCVPQQFQHYKTPPRYRKESKSLELLPADDRNDHADGNLMDANGSKSGSNISEFTEREFCRPKGTNEEEETEEEEHVGLLKNMKEDEIIIKVPNSDHPTGGTGTYNNRLFKSVDYQTIESVPNNEGFIDINSECLMTVQRLSVASGESPEADEETRWESSDQLRPLDSDTTRRDKDTAITSVKFSKRVKAVKQWLGSLLGRRTPSPIEDHFSEEIERESIV